MDQMRVGPLALRVVSLATRRPPLICLCPSAWSVYGKWLVALEVFLGYRRSSDWHGKRTLKGLSPRN